MGVWKSTVSTTPKSPLDTLKTREENAITRLQSEGFTPPAPLSEKKTPWSVVTDILGRPFNALSTAAKYVAKDPNAREDVGVLFEPSMWKGLWAGLTGKDTSTVEDIQRTDPNFDAAKHTWLTKAEQIAIPIAADPVVVATGGGAGKFIGSAVGKGILAGISQSPEVALAAEKLLPALKYAPTAIRAEEAAKAGLSSIEQKMGNVGGALKQLFSKGGGNPQFAEDLRKFRATRDFAKQNVIDEVKGITKDLTPAQEAEVRRLLESGQLTPKERGPVQAGRFGLYNEAGKPAITKPTLPLAGGQPTDAAVLKAAQEAKSKVLDWIPEQYGKEGIPLNVRESYFPHVKAEESTLDKLQGYFKRRPIKVRDPFAQRRTLEGTIEEINQGAGKQVFREDLGVPLAVRKQAAVDVIESKKFLRDTLQKYGKTSEQLAAEAPVTAEGAARPPVTNIRSGMKVSPTDRNNIGTVIGYDEASDTVTVHFRSPEGLEATKTFPSGDLRAMENSGYRSKADAMLPEGYSWVSPDTGAILKGADARHAGAVAMPTEIAGKLDGIMSIVKNPDEAVQEFQNAYRWFRKTWGAAVTVWRPAFHANNFIGGTLNNFLAGMRDPRRYQQAADVIRGKAGELVTEAGERISYDTLKEALRKTGTLNAGISGTLEDSLIREAEAELGKGATISKPFRWYDEKMRALGRSVENELRSALFIDRVAKGETFDQAAKTVIDFHFDYSPEGLDKAGQLLKPWVPFWVWLRNNLALQVQEMFKQPGTYIAYEKLRKGVTDKREGVPDYMDFAIPLGKVGDRNIVINLRTPIEDVRQFAEEPVSQSVSSLVPPVKVATDLIYNQNSFTGGPIQKFEGERSPFLWGTADPRFIYALRNLTGTLGSVEKNAITEPIANKGMQPKNAISLGSNILPGLSSYNPEETKLSQAYERDQQLQDALKVAAQQLGRPVIDVETLKKATKKTNVWKRSGK